MRIWLCVGVVLWCMCSAGVKLRVKVETSNSSEQTDEYAEHYKHGDDMFYKGTFVIAETWTSVLNPKGNDDTSLRSYRVLGTDVEFQTEVVDTELSHDQIVSLKRQGFRIIIK